jgi:TetR/AcrR family transcriptional regulator, transcriptional repressor for nem operon
MASRTEEKTGRKVESRERILASAGALVREKGIAGASVSGVMEGAGMTVGGFYAHFPSKQELVTETVGAALRQSLDTLNAAAGERAGAEWLEAATRAYLSRPHRDHPEAGCPLPATLGEIAREEAPVREALERELSAIVSVIAAHLEEAGVEEPRGEALAVLAMMVGGLSLARALKGTPLSDAVLKACRGHLGSCLEMV